MTQIHLAMLTTDWILWALFVLGIAYAFWAHAKRHLREAWAYVFTKPLGMMAIVILSVFISIGLLDSIHFNIKYINAAGQQTNAQIKSLLDIIVDPLGQQHEKTYSAPFAKHLYNKSIITLPNGQEKRGYAPLKNINADRDIGIRCLIGFACGIVSFILITFPPIFYIKRRRPNTKVAWRSFLITFGILWVIVWMVAFTATSYHILGTDKVGRDVFYESINSIRTGLLIGTLATLVMLPFALILGTMAGYFQGWIDDVIQYTYTTLSSIPGVLLISAAILVIQVYISNHPAAFATLRDRADARLLALCIILGITSWASLCRLLRAETLKIRELGYIRSAQALGVRSFTTIMRHIIPNVMHIVLITVVLDFSNLVLAEAVLSYVGVGVDPTTISWGNMINASRLELAREPIVWWPLAAALILMFVLILAANIFSDTVRDAFDPKIAND
ncbi:MAG: peptide ABC transporter permease [Coxiella sp. (in: Bacteria)]|nr:MAG: peptide ABC transporter permease [Coxiella sp. (in: g-proteobacteria)]